MSSARMRLGEQAVRRSGVQLLDEPERRRAGDLVAGHQRALDGRGAPPGREHREVQVDPAVRRDVEQRPGGAARRRRPPGSSRGQIARAGSRKSGSLGLGRLAAPRGRARRPARPPATASADRPRPAGASGRVTTATTSCRLSSTACSDGSAASGVPAKTSRIGVSNPRPNIGCGRLLDDRRRQAAPLRLADRLHRGLAGRGVEPVDEQDAVEVVGLVLDAAGQLLGALDDDRLAVHVEPAAPRRRTPAMQSKVSPGMDRQPSSPSWVVLGQGAASG